MGTVVADIGPSVPEVEPFVADVERPGPSSGPRGAHVEAPGAAIGRRGAGVEPIVAEVEAAESVEDASGASVDPGGAFAISRRVYPIGEENGRTRKSLGQDSLMVSGHMS
jgi:hypothetical protein